MATYVDVLEEIRLRVDNAMRIGGKLQDVTMLRMVDISRNTILMTTPYIAVWLAEATERWHSTQTKCSELEIKIAVGAKKVFDPKNNVYDAESEAGANFLTQRVLDAIETNVFGKIEPTFSPLLNEMPRLNIRPLEYEGYIGTTIIFRAETTPFFPGQRSELTMAAPIMTESGAIPLVKLLKISAGDSDILGTLPSLRDTHGTAILNGKKISIVRWDHGDADVIISGYSSDQTIGGDVSYSLAGFQSQVTLTADAGTWVIGD